MRPAEEAAEEVAASGRSGGIKCKSWAKTHDFSFFILNRGANPHDLIVFFLNRGDAKAVISHIDDIIR